MSNFLKMTKPSCERVLKLASILLCLYLIPEASSGKCSGKWGLQACMGGNGKRSDGDRSMGPGADDTASLFLRRLMLPTKFPSGTPYDDRWPTGATEPESYNEPSKEGVMLELFDILGQIEKARELRRQAEQYQGSL